jgi:hypothetical protein
MLEYTGAGGGSRLMMLVLHDDAQREYAYGPAKGLPDTKVGTLPQRRLFQMPRVAPFNPARVARQRQLGEFRLLRSTPSQVFTVSKHVRS